MMDERWGPQTMYGLGLLSLFTLKALESDLAEAAEKSWMACPQEWQALEEVRAELKARQEGE